MVRTPVSVDVRGELLFLGTGTSLGVPVIGCDCDTCISRDPRNFRTRCGLVLGLPAGNLLVDTPPDLWRQLIRERIGRINATLFTHEHADHLFGLDDLRLFAHYLGHPVPIYCEPAVEARIRKSFDYAFAPEAVNIHPGGVPQLEFRRIGLEPFETLGETVIPFRLRHGRFNVLGFRFGRVAYCTDTNGIPEESWPYIQDLDVLILDALRHAPHPTHFSLGEAIEVAQRAGAKRTIFTHISHDLEYSATNAALPPAMELAFDGMRIPLT